METPNHACGIEKEHLACGLKDTFRLIGDLWTLMIVYNLLSGKKRFGELLEALGNVSPKTVSQRLKMLEEARIVLRNAYAEIPPRVEYSLTEKGFALADILKAIQEFDDRYPGDPVLESVSALPECSTKCPSEEV